MNPLTFNELLENNSKIEYVNLNKGSLPLKELINEGHTYFNVKCGRSYYWVAIQTRYALTCQIRKFEGGYSNVPKYLGFVTITKSFVLSKEFVNKFELIRDQQRLFVDSKLYIKKYGLAQNLG